MKHETIFKKKRDEMYILIIVLRCSEKAKQAEEAEKQPEEKVEMYVLTRRCIGIICREEKEQVVEKKAPKKIKDKELVRQRKKERKEKEKEAFPGKEGAFQYLESWRNDRENWKFKKNKQVLLSYFNNYDGSFG